MISRKIRAVLFSFLAVLSVQIFSGCATIFTGTSDEISFNANVPDVTLTLAGQVKGTLPLKLKVSRGLFNGVMNAKFEKKGYVSQEFILERDFNGVAVLDITSIPTSGGIDLATGSLTRFSPTEYHIQMLEAGKDAKSASFKRSLNLYRFVLLYHEKIQNDMIAKNGENLSALTELLSNGKESDSKVISNEIVANRDYLQSNSAYKFIDRLNEVLSRDEHLKEYRM